MSVAHVYVECAYLDLRVLMGRYPYENHFLVERKSGSSEPEGLHHRAHKLQVACEGLRELMEEHDVNHFEY
jgi:hypothetical protein